MGVCRRVIKEYTPSELTITVTVWSEPRKPPRFDKWEIKKAGCPPRIIPCSRSTYSSVSSGNATSSTKRRVVRKKDEKEKVLLSSDSASLIADDDVAVASVVDEDVDDVARERHVSVTSLESVAGLGDVSASDDVEKLKAEVLAEDVRGDSEVENVITTSDDVSTSEMDGMVDEVAVKDSEEVKKTSETAKLLKNASFDLFSNGDVAMPTIELVQPPTPKKQVLRRKKKKSKTPEDRYRDFTETTINMYVEMEKRNVGEFVWDRQCTRIDALVAPILELDRTTTPEIPVEIEIFD